MSIKFIVFSCISGFLTGILSVLFLNFINTSIKFLWVEIPNLLNLSSLYFLSLGVIGGVLIGLLNVYIGEYPRTLHQTIEQYKNEKSIDYIKEFWKNFLLGVTVLIFGASMGPEATLVALIASIITWLNNKLQLDTINDKRFLQANIIAITSTIFLSPFMSSQKQEEKSFKQIVNSTFYFIVAILGILGFILTNQFIPGEKFFSISFEKIDINIQSFSIIFPAILGGLFFGYLFTMIEKLIEKFAFNFNKFFLSVFCGILIGLSGVYSPILLYSGEEDLLLLSKEMFSLNSLELLFISFGKMTLTHICFASGWRGGKIFPTIFSSVTFGYLFASIFPYDKEIVVAVVASSSLTLIIKKPIFIAFLFVFLLPIQYTFFVILTILIIHFSKKMQSKFLKFSNLY